MRIHRLDLLRYGPFTDKILNFRRDAKLHLVFGPNEAGKSSSLAAIGDLLFGFAKRKEYDFLHDAATLRIGAELVSHDGATLGFRRRRGNKKTLLSPDDEEAALHEDVLLPYLGNLNREVFSRAFGLNSETLRNGGSAMLESEGEMGAALFAAASGLTGLARIRRTLEAEADAIFAPRASKDRSFYQALERYDGAITAERQTELKSGDWKSLVAEIEEVEGRLAEIKALRTETSAALARLQRLKVLQPILNATDDLTDQLSAYEDLPEVPEGFVVDCAAALDRAEGASGQERMAEEEVNALARALEAIGVDEAMLERSVEITDLFSRKGDYLSKLADIPRIQAEQEEFTATLADLAQRLGLRDVDEVVRRLPSDAVIESMRSLIETGQRLETLIATHEKRLVDEQGVLETDEEENYSSGLSDPKPWRDQLAALAPDLKQIGDQVYLETSHRNMAQKLKDSALRLVPPVADVEALVRAVLPSRETIAGHRAIFERILGDRRAATIRLESIAEEAAEVGRLLAETEQSGPTAYSETIAVARSERDATFEELRNHLFRTGTLMLAEQLEEKIAQFDEESAEADSIADQAIADADRISRLASYRAKLADFARQKPEIEARLAELAEEQTRAAQAYGALFATAGVTPVGPDAMVNWLGSVEDLLATRRDVATLADQIANLERLGQQIHGALLRIGKAVGIEGVEALPSLALSRLITTRLDEMTAKWTARMTFEGVRQAARVRIGQIEDVLSKARQDHKIWHEQFEAGLPSIGLGMGVTTAGAAAALAAWTGVPEISKQRSNRAGRVAGMARDTTTFEEDVYALGRELAPVLVHLPAPTLIDALRDRSDAARAAKVRHDDAKARLEAAQAKLATARGAHDAATAALSALSSMLPEGSDPRAELIRLERRDALAAQLTERRKAFEAHAEGFSEAAVRDELPSFDRDRAQFDAEDLERKSESLHAENNRLYALLGQKQGRRETLEAGTGAELAAFERNGAETEIIATARQWAVRKIAATMLNAAIEKHREAQSDPLMLRAGALFSTLTSGSFSGLLQDYDSEDDQPRLVGVRKSGERVFINGMSEGTRDQLYLSLRLAYIEDYADRAEPVPFIGDDIFQTFDDERTASGLKAFASTAVLFQPILFTHHLSVVAIARRALGDDLDLIEL
jgi:chromosome segregation protein